MKDVKKELTSRLRTDLKWAKVQLADANDKIERINKELARRKETGQLKAERRVTFSQIGGDDGYHWAVLVDGRVVWNGLTQREIQHYKRIEVEKLLQVDKVFKTE